MADDIIIPRHHYEALIGAANLLVTVSANAVETILSETPYEDMLRNPVMALREALANVPGANTWDGSWREEDVIYDVYRHEAQQRNLPDVGVKATHVPTGLSTESYMKSTEEANRDAARKGLMARVERHGRQLGLL
jgi:protein subunit release factor B